MLSRTQSPHAPFFLTPFFEKARERPTVRGQGRSLLTRAPMCLSASSGAPGGTCCMTSIAHQDSLCQPQPLSHPHGAGDLDPAIIRQFWDEAKRQMVTGDYLRRKWLPRQGHRFYSLIKVL